MDYLLSASSRREAERRWEALHQNLFSWVIDRVVWEEMQCDLPPSLDAVDQEAEVAQDLALLVRGRVAVRLLTLWEEHHDPQQAAEAGNITHIRAYIMAAARNACVDYLRQEYPGRHALNNSLRLAFETRADLSLWQVYLSEGQEEWQCGLTNAQGHAVVPLRSSEGLRATLAGELAGLGRGEALSRLFAVVGGPLRFTELLGFLAELWDVEAAHRRAMREGAEFRVQKVYHEGLQPEEVADRIGTYQSIWAMVRRLAPAQAAVLLLKAPASGDVNELLEMVRLGTMDWLNIASVTGLPVKRLREVAPNVPLEDQEIAALIEVAPEDVPRIRQDAHRRLARWRDRKKK
jgi:hypothetical protein